MSTRRNRPQKHQNAFAFVPNKFSPVALKISKTPVCGCCAKCVSIIDLKKQYGKYKPLTRPSICLVCTRRSIYDAYHTICRDCAVNQCCKCGIQLSDAEKSSSTLLNGNESNNLSPLSSGETIPKLLVDERMPLRKLRTFNRKVEHGDYTGAQLILDEFRSLDLEKDSLDGSSSDFSDSDSQEFVKEESFGFADK